MKTFSINQKFINKKILITGTNSGLGHYLKEKIFCESFCRSNNNIQNNTNSYDVIIHCAFNMKRFDSDEYFYEYIEDTINLTKSLTSLNHKLFIFISSIDVYPINGQKHSEKEIINPNELKGIYPTFKLACESIVKEKSKDFLILRPGILLGNFMRSNNLTKILSGKSNKITLSEKSSYHCVLYEDILSTIEYSLNSTLTGIYNIVRSKEVKINSLVKRFNPNLKFGTYNYSPDPICNEKISEKIPIFKKTSLDAVNAFISLNKDNIK